MQSPILSIDTSGSFCSVALRCVDGSHISQHSGGAGDHFEQLPGLVSGVCAEGGVGLNELAHVLIGVGPGSFTGIRIGMSFAKGLAWSARIGCSGVCSFLGAALAEVRRGVRDGRVTVVADARRSEAFYALYAITAGAISVEVEPCILTTAQVLQRAGEGGRHLSPQREFAIAGIEIHPSAEIALGSLAVSQRAQVFSVGDLAAVEPSYIREVSAMTIEQRRRMRSGASGGLD